MSKAHQGCLDAWVPRGLLGSTKNLLSGSVTAEGLCPINLTWGHSHIESVQVINSASKFPKRLVLPRLIEPHTHIDKAFTWQEFPNLEGTYQEALASNLREHKNRTARKVRNRAERALKLALRNGVRAIRSHVDSLWPEAEETLKTLQALRNEWRDSIELQLVALVPLEHWSTERGESLAAQVADCGGLLGGVVLPPANRKNSYNSFRKMFELAEKFQCGIDLHIDESQIQPAAGLKQLVKVLDQIDVNVPITCSHASSMGLLPPRALKFLAERLAHHQVNVIALPITNSWLLGRANKSTPINRPLAPIFELQQAGVKVAIGGDNVQDAWYPSGNLDPLSLMAFSMPIAQLAPWQRIGLSPFTTAAAAIMNLKWDGKIERGSPADLIILEVGSWSEALISPPKREVIVNGSLINDQSITKYHSTQVED